MDKPWAFEGTPKGLPSINSQKDRTRWIACKTMCPLRHFLTFLLGPSIFRSAPPFSPRVVERTDARRAVKPAGRFQAQPVAGTGLQEGIKSRVRSGMA